MRQVGRLRGVGFVFGFGPVHFLEGVFHSGCGLISHRWRPMAVQVHRDPDAGVSQKGLDELGMYPLREQHRGAGVPQVVEADIGQARPLQQRLEAAPVFRM